jgi:hypothetical protein
MTWKILSKISFLSILVANHSPFPNANAKNGDTWEQLYKVPHFHRVCCS